MKKSFTIKIVSVLSAAAGISVLMRPFPADTAELTGDLSGEGMISASDAALLQSHLAGIGGLPSDILSDADIITDGSVNIFDLCALKMQASTPVQSGEILEEKGMVHSGYATFYGGGYEGGCAMLDPISKEDYWITAMNIVDYNNAQLAGAYLEVTGELGTIHVLVTDLLPEGQKGDLDLYVDAFPLIAPAEKGKVPVTWKIIPLDSAENAPVSYKYKEGSSAFWCGVQVRNHRYPIAKLEYLDASGNFVELPRRHYNYFESDNMGAGPFTFRITDIYGSVIVDENIPLTPDEIQQGHVQFPE